MPFIFNFSQLYTLYRLFYLNFKIPITEVSNALFIGRQFWHIYYKTAYSITVQLLDPRHLEEDYPIRTVSENKRLLSVFANGPIIFVNLRAVSREVSKFKRYESFQWLHIVESWILLVRLQKYLRIFSFQKSLSQLDNLLPSAPVRVVPL